MYSSGLVLEGGGCRAIYTSGVLDAFMEHNITFPYVIGVSAGSCNGASFLGDNYKRQHDITINYCNDKRYMSFANIIKHGEFLNTEWVFDELSFDLMPLDQENFEHSGAVLCAVATNSETGKPEYFYPKSLRHRGLPELKASCSLPGATKGVDIDGTVYFDGGLTDSVPLKHAFEDGCKKAVVILTQHSGYVKKEFKKPELIRKALKKYPIIAEATIERHKMYNDQLAYVAEQQKLGNAFVIAPTMPLHCSTLERDTKKLEEIYQIGYKQGLENIDKIKEFLKD